MRAKNAAQRPHVFLVMLHHRTRGPLVGLITAWAWGQSTWTTQWDVGTIDRDPRLSDHWFCQERYERQFTELLQSAANRTDAKSFELPGATLRWGSAKGMGREVAVELASQLFGLWEQILTEWEAHPA